MPHDENIRVITSQQLRDNFPVIRKGLTKGTRYILLYRGQPVAEIGPVSTKTNTLFSVGAPPPPLALPKTAAGRRIKRNTAKRRGKRLRN